MQQIATLWQSLAPMKRAIVVLAALAMFAAVYGVAHLATRPAMTLLYAGLDESRAGEILAALDQRAVKYEVRGGAIYVDGAGRDALRMELAAQGLPANSGEGYELLDSLSGFGTTSQMFDAAYWRAKEGELGRTIAALPNMRSVRVHISNVEPQGFRARSEPKASVTVTTRDGGIATTQARALRFLVSAAVAGMKPDDVAIIDSQNGLVASDADGAGRAGDEKAADLRENVLRLLEARVGYGNAVVEVAVEPVTDSEAISERTLDPQGRVAIASENEDNSSNATDSGKSGVSVASNLPSGNAKGSASGSQSSDSQTRERVNYDVSETKRDIVRAPGAIKRLTVAVLINDPAAPAGSGASTPQVRPQEELDALRDLVAAAVGFDDKRGDVITIKSLAFQPATVTEPGPGASLLSTLQINVMTLVQLAILAVVALVLGLFVVRPILTARPARLQSLPAPAPRPPERAITGTIADGELMPENLPTVGSVRDSVVAPADGDPVSRLRRLIAERQDETVEVLRNWIEDPKTERA